MRRAVAACAGPAGYGVADGVLGGDVMEALAADVEAASFEPYGFSVGAGGAGKHVDASIGEHLVEDWDKKGSRLYAALRRIGDAVARDARAAAPCLGVEARYAVELRGRAFFGSFDVPSNTNTREWSRSDARETDRRAWHASSAPLFLR